MAARKLNFQQITIAYSAATFSSVTTAAVGCYLASEIGYHPDYGIAISSTWLLTVGLGSLIGSVSAVKKVFGHQPPNSIKAASADNLRRRIPITANDKTSSVFLSVLPLGFNPQTTTPSQQNPLPIPDRFEVSIDGIGYTILQPELEQFLYSAWKRQRSGQAPFSRNYWLKDRRPDRLNRVAYEAIITLLLSIDGLIVDRRHGNSGRLTIPPQMAISAIQTAVF